MVGNFCTLEGRRKLLYLRGKREDGRASKRSKAGRMRRRGGMGVGIETRGEEERSWSASGGKIGRREKVKNKKKKRWPGKGTLRGVSGSSIMEVGWLKETNKKGFATTKQRKDSTFVATMTALSKTFPTPPFLRWLPATPTPPRRRFSTFLSPDGAAADTDRVEELLASPRDVGRLMKMDRRAGRGKSGDESRWFPYCDRFTYGGWSLTSREVVEALEPHILEERRERMRRAVGWRSYGLCLVVEGLTDFGNVSAAFRSADALGVQNVHVVSCDSSKRCCFF